MSRFMTEIPITISFQEACLTFTKRIMAKKGKLISDFIVLLQDLEKPKFSQSVEDSNI